MMTTVHTKSAMVYTGPQVKSAMTQRGVQIQKYHNPVPCNGIVHIVKSVNNDNSEDVECA